MSVIRAIKDSLNPFVQINKKVFDDPNLSLKAKGLIGFCLSKPDHWVFRINHLEKVLKEKEKALYSTLNECINQGYALRFQHRQKNGDFGLWETIVSDSKEEIQRLIKTLEKDPGFQKMFTLRRFGDPLNGDPQKEELVIPNLSNTDLKETTTSSSFSEHAEESKKSVPDLKAPTKQSTPKKPSKSKASSFLIDERLKGLDIPTSSKQTISKHFDGPTIEKAIAWATNPLTKIKKSLEKAIYWACENPDKLEIKNKEQDTKENKAYAKEIHKKAKIPSTVNFEVLNSYVEIGQKGGNSLPTIIDYVDRPSVFRGLLASAMKKYKIE
jgi:hypothetical protein